MDGILTPEQLQALEAQANLQHQDAQRRAMLSNLEKDAAMVAKYSDIARQSQVRQPFATAYFGQLGPASPIKQAPVEVPASDRIGYAREAARLQGDIQRRIQEAGLMQGPVQQTQAEQVAPQSSPEQPKPAAAPSAPAQPAPAPEKPQYDPFAEFNRINDVKQKFYDIALNELNQLPARQRAAGLKLVGEIWNSQGPKIPSNMAVPLIDSSSGKPLEGYALIGGKVEKIDRPKVEAKALTEAQEKNLKFAGAMHRANKEYENLVRASGYDPSNPLNRLPMFEMLKTQNRKLYEGIVNEFTNAINRDQSGASVTPAEFQAAERRYFPLAGDTEEVLKAKEARRKEMVASMYDLVPEYARDKIPSYGTNQQQQSAPGAGGGFYFNTKTGRMEPR